MPPILIKRPRSSGFTLVEVAIVTPMIVIVVLGILSLLIVLVRNNTLEIVRGSTVSDTRAALTSIQKDVETSTQFFPSTLPAANYVDFNQPGSSGTYKINGTLPSGTTSTNLNTFFVQSYNQIVDPTDSTGTKIIAAFKGSPPCSGTTLSQTSNITSIAVLYFVTNGVLYRRTLVDTTNPTTCGTLLIHQACPSGSDGNTPACSVKDLALIQNVTQFKIDYYLNTNDTIPMNAYIASPNPTIDQAKAIGVTLSSSTIASGTVVSHSASLRIAQNNN